MGNPDYNILSFPGLGIGEFQISPVAFTVFGRDIAWYGIIITLGMILAFLYASSRAKFEKISSDDLLDYAIFIIVCGVIGARAYYVLMKIENYNTFYDAIAIWNGGLAIYGGVIGGVLAIIGVSLVKKFNIAKMLDIVAPSCMIGQILGRWGNFMNAEAFGSETTLPWRMGIHQIGYKTYLTPIYVHPTFLYESLWNLVGFVIIHSLYKKKKYDGQVCLMYVVWYGFGRMFIEGLRTDSLMVGSIRISQLLAFVSCIIGIVLLVVFGTLAKKGKKAKEAVENNTEE